MNAIDDALKEAGKEAGKAALLSKLPPGMSDDDDEESKSKFNKLKFMVLFGGSAIGLVMLGLMLLGALKWLIGVGLLAGFGWAGWMLARPRLQAKMEEAKAALGAKRAADEAAEAAEVAEVEQRLLEDKREQETVAAEQSIEDQLAAMKKSL